MNFVVADAPFSLSCAPVMSTFEVSLKLRLRELEEPDFNKSFLSLLSQLSDVGMAVTDEHIHAYKQT
jgi:hypothetical protein